MSKKKSTAQPQLDADMEADLLDLCGRLCDEAKAKKLAGMIAIPIYKLGHRRKYTLLVAGLASQYPTFAVGAMWTCLFLLGEVALADSGAVDTRQPPH